MQKPKSEILLWGSGDESEVTVPWQWPAFSFGYTWGLITTGLITIDSTILHLKAHQNKPCFVCAGNVDVTPSTWPVTNFVFFYFIYSTSHQHSFTKQPGGCTTCYSHLAQQVILPAEKRFSEKLSFNGRLSKSTRWRRARKEKRWETGDNNLLTLSFSYWSLWWLHVQLLTQCSLMEKSE